MKIAPTQLNKLKPNDINNSQDNTYIDDIFVDKLIDLGSQIWITTTETDSFLKKYDNVHYYELKRE